jgi:hypothetical protein
MIARTETASALEDAMLTRSKAMGVTGKEWITHDPCTICEAFGDEGAVPIDFEYFYEGESYGQRPPAHPNAVFAESSFGSYGSLFQIVRSQYSGPARRIETDRVSFTIGPNHPILTWRGWIKASEINIGDQLLYDRRVNNPGILGMDSNLDKMPTIQDAFDSLTLMFGYSAIASPRTYFHGDEVFAYGKVDVILPTRDLLPVFNPEGIEDFGKLRLMGPNTKLPLVTCISSCRHSRERVTIPTSSLMGSFDLMQSLLWCHSLPSFYESATVSHIENLHYNGWAYDASTSSGLYNSSGIVVKNCRCALAPVMI